MRRTEEAFEAFIYAQRDMQHVAFITANNPTLDVKLLQKLGHGVGCTAVGLQSLAVAMADIYDKLVAIEKRLPH